MGGDQPARSHRIGVIGGDWIGPELVDSAIAVLDAAADTLLMTRPGVERVVRFAFDAARARRNGASRRATRVTCVDKANVLKSHAFFRDVFDEVAAANVRHAHADFEPVHGSAPDLAGSGRANPTAQIVSDALLPGHLGEPDAAERIRAAVARAYADGLILLDPGGRPECGTTGVTDAVLACM